MRKLIGLFLGASLSLIAQTEITLIAPIGAVDKLIPGFEKKTDYKVKPTFGTGLVTKKQVADGEPFDIPIVQVPYEEVVKSGHVVVSSMTPLASSRVGVAVKKGAPKFADDVDSNGRVSPAKRRERMKIINEQDALEPLRRKRTEAMPTLDDRLERVRNGVIPAVMGFVESFGGESEMAMFVVEDCCWFFGNEIAIRSSIHAPHEASELTCYMRARDFGPITIIRNDGKLLVRIGGIAGSEPIDELEAVGWDAGALDAVIPFLFGRGGSDGKKVL